ncbi:hypothetical protein GCM10011342_01480 [Aquisalinus flavus]|uniref:Uncharacterized protein n=2 Tax=Aquisalinus flavus TaxID=1526572 RepID=A0A8J2V3Y9_9PROT|nr:hypothetical protein GCM10011342_01480 [Aquisalinus flavus]
MVAGLSACAIDPYRPLYEFLQPVDDESVTSKRLDALGYRPHVIGRSITYATLRRRNDDASDDFKTITAVDKDIACARRHGSPIFVSEEYQGDVTQACSLTSEQLERLEAYIPLKFDDFPIILVPANYRSYIYQWPRVTVSDSGLLLRVYEDGNADPMAWTTFFHERHHAQAYLDYPSVMFSPRQRIFLGEIEGNIVGDCAAEFYDLDTARNSTDIFIDPPRADEIRQIASVQTKLSTFLFERRGRGVPQEIRRLDWYRQNSPNMTGAWLAEYLSKQNGGACDLLEKLTTARE